MPVVFIVNFIFIALIVLVYLCGL